MLKEIYRKFEGEGASISELKNATSSDAVSSSNRKSVEMQSHGEEEAEEEAEEEWEIRQQIEATISPISSNNEEETNEEDERDDERLKEFTLLAKCRCKRIIKKRSRYGEY